VLQPRKPEYESPYSHWSEHTINLKSVTNAYVKIPVDLL
jgi:hypothetical protein